MLQGQVFLKFLQISLLLCFQSIRFCFLYFSLFSILLSFLANLFKSFYIAITNIDNLLIDPE